MKIKIVLFLFFVIYSFLLPATNFELKINGNNSNTQIDSVKASNWTTQVKTSFNISHVSFKDWSQGGSNSLTWVFGINSVLNYSDSNWTLKNTQKLSYGRTKLEEDEFRTNDNEFFIESVVSRKYGWEVDPFFAFSIRSPLSEGYSYKKLPPSKIANFFDPGYVTQSLGFNYDKIKAIRTRVGIALQEVFTNEFRNHSDDKATKEKAEAFKLDTGFESVTDGEIKFDTNISYKSSFRLFTRFNSLDIWDIRWDNSILAKVNSYINVSFNFLLIYEKNQSYKTQMKETLLLGLTYTLI